METSSLDDEHSSRVLFSGPRNKWTAAFHLAFSSVPYYNQKKPTHQDRRFKSVQTKIKDWFGLHDGMTSHFSRPSTGLVLLFCSWLNQLVDIFFSVPEKRISTNSFTFVALTKTWWQKSWVFSSPWSRRSIELQRLRLLQIKKGVFDLRTTFSRT